jgi:hypothetical protein
LKKKNEKISALRERNLRDHNEEENTELEERNYHKKITVINLKLIKGAIELKVKKKKNW